MRKTVTFIGISTLFIVLLFSAFFTLLRFEKQYPLYSLEKGWVATYRNQQYLNTELGALSDQIGVSFSRGDKITLTLPKLLKSCEAPFPYLIFKTECCSYEVFLDGKLIAYEGLDAVANGSYIGNGYNIVPLEPDYAGKKLSINLYVTENNTKANVVNMMMGDFDDLYRNLMYTATFPLITGIFLIVFGHIFLLISLVFYMRSSDVFNQIVCSIIGILLGLWLLTEFDCFTFLLDKATATFIGYSALYLLVPTIYSLIYSLHKRYDGLVLSIMGYGSLAFSFLFIALHLTDKVHIHHFIIPYYLLALISFLFLVVYDFIDFKSKSKNPTTQILMFGLTLLSISLILTALTDVTRPNLDCRDNILMTNVIPATAMFFVITQLLNHFVFMTRIYAQRKEYASLAQIAFEDALTQLPNRACADKRLADLDESDSDFCIVSLDLNGLKEVNDNDGHPAGDKLLKSFSSALSSTFKGLGECFRIGGDEFMVISDSIDKDKVVSLLDLLDKKLLDLDKEDPGINHSVSHGFAFRSEAEDKDTHAVFMLADQRMYNNKKTYYARKNISKTK
ncbi:GGDEF domain-containing protein [Butyrivibrio sp. XB500-5]|uniref:GGDEF domain-containing protein n=1 Tax=Butyrivibrio sp. XB500-5 TaxID=2364880 RepID=UPI000EAA4DBF|nr:GGDEF domain-containing protein [Butyrivibrio sp. XB500-5]RKM61656.1 GGDEF domain-containing protein [Butyrivibrio sp. XB500-5]